MQGDSGQGQGSEETGGDPEKNAHEFWHEGYMIWRRVSSEYCIVAKKRQLRKRAEEVNVKVNFFTTGSTKEHRVKAHRVKPILPVFPCSSVLPVVKRFDEQKFRRDARDNLIHSSPLKP